MSPELMAAIDFMRAKDGLYVAIDPAHPGAIVPILVLKGKCYSMRIDQELAPEKFHGDAKFTGPLYQIL